MLGSIAENGAVAVLGQGVGRDPSPAATAHGGTVVRLFARFHINVTLVNHRSTQ